MEIQLTDQALRQYRDLSPTLKKKVDKQFRYLLIDFRHPSLQAKKYQGLDDVWQGRIDKNWRFYFYVIEPSFIVVSIISHPK